MLFSKSSCLGALLSLLAFENPPDDFVFLLLVHIGHGGTENGAAKCEGREEKLFSLLEGLLCPFSRSKGCSSMTPICSNTGSVSESKLTPPGTCLALHSWYLPLSEGSSVSLWAPSKVFHSKQSGKIKHSFLFRIMYLLYDR